MFAVEVDELAKLTVSPLKTRFFNTTMGTFASRAFAHDVLQDQIHRLGTGMRLTFGATFFALALMLLPTYAQDEEEVPIFKAGAASAFVWGEDSTPGAVSTVVRDP